MGFLTKTQLLSKQKLKIERLDLDDENFVYITEMSGRSRDEFEASLREEIVGDKGEVTFKAKLDNYRAKVACATLCDEEGNLLLTAAEAPVLSENMGGIWLDKISTAASKLNGITAKDKEELLKNSEGDLTKGGSSESVETA